MMITARASFALEHGRAPKFASPNNERVLQQASLFQVGKQRPSRSIGQLAANTHISLQVAVMVPAAVVQLNEAHAAFRQASGQQTVGGVGAIARLGSVHFQGGW